MKYVYSFKEGNKDMKNILGGKGANLAEMVGLGLPVPMGFTVSCDACLKYYEDNCSINSSIEEEISIVISPMGVRSSSSASTVWGIASTAAAVTARNRPHFPLYFFFVSILFLVSLSLFCIKTPFFRQTSSQFF